MFFECDDLLEVFDVSVDYTLDPSIFSKIDGCKMHSASRDVKTLEQVAKMIFFEKCDASDAFHVFSNKIGTILW